jgi:hypothetical protein
MLKSGSTIPVKKFRPPFSCHFTKIGCSLTFIVFMIDVCKLNLKFITITHKNMDTI